MFRRASPSGNFSARTRAAYLDRFERETFDLAVVGGGITGAGIARDAAMRGLSVALVEKSDFAAGTSSSSSRMIHGGLRYLRHRQVRLVREALREREVLLKIAPHLAYPFPFLLPVYQGSRDSRLKLKVGLTGYDLLAGSRLLEHHVMLSREELLRTEPALRRKGLRGGFRYFDCLVSDARLTLATVLSAARQGAAAVSYVEAIDLERDDGRVTGIRFRDRLNGQTGVLRARLVVNAAGPWVDQLRAMGGAAPILRPTKGIHLVVPRSRLPLSSVVMMTARDGRMLFAVPQGDCTYVGTTDTDYRDDPDAVRTEASDVEYILDAANAAFEGANVEAADVISTWAGVRPLVAEEGAPAPSDVSRDYEVRMEPEGLVSIAGGKLTTYRAMAEDLVNRIVAREGKRFGWSPGPCRTGERPLVGGELEGFEQYCEATAQALEESWGLSPAVSQRLLRTYGTEHVRVLGYALRDRRLLRPLAPGCPVLRAEALHAAEEEMALTLEDFMARRTELMLFDGNRGLDAAGEAARLMGKVLGWGWRERREQVSRYGKAVARMTAFAAEEAGSASEGA
ncbi:MAG: glycerol-3-phosphate dehydrogenase [Dehalococcoidia bacterium]